jgi:hypothetical protein
LFVTTFYRQLQTVSGWHDVVFNFDVSGISMLSMLHTTLLPSRKVFSFGRIQVPSFHCLLKLISLVVLQLWKTEWYVGIGMTWKSVRKRSSISGRGRIEWKLRTL